MTRIILADDHPIVRRGIRSLLDAEKDLTVVEEAADGLEAVRLVERLKPEVLVVDLMMPGLGGLEVVREVKQRSPRTRVVVLSMHDNEAYVREALANGAEGYVLKDSEGAELVAAVRRVLTGRRYLSPVLSDRAIEAYARHPEDAPEDSYQSLSTREREVLHLSAEGMRNSEIAERLSLSPRTVETHRSNLMRKLGLETQTDLIRYAIRRGIIPG